MDGVMADRLIRFGVGDGSKRAATWKCWNTKGTNDVYVACRELGGALKTSLHESGSWHVAFSWDYLEKNADFPSTEWPTRYIEKWPKPPDIATGVTLAYRIVTPAASVTTAVVPDQTTGVLWIAPAADGFAVEIDILISRPSAVLRSWPGRTSMGTQLVGSFLTEAGDTVWVVNWTIPVPDSKEPLTGRGRFFKGRSAADLAEPNVRAILFGDEPDGSRKMIDCVFPPAAGSEAM
jgi:hypothetical protein